MTHVTPLQRMIYLPLFAALIALLSILVIPTPAAPVTLQTLGVLLAVGLLGGQQGTMAVLLYLLLGAVGLPVYAGMQGGVGVLLGPTGGYLFGFLVTALLMWAVERLFGSSLPVLALSMVVGLGGCYALGTLYFVWLTTGSITLEGILSGLSLCVFPYLLPDGVKLLLALTLTRRLKKILKISA